MPGPIVRVLSFLLVVALCLPDTPDVEACLFGAKGVAGSLKPGAVVIDFSTISAGATAEFARRLAAQGAMLIDSPVSGGPQGAIDGVLTCMVGGDAAAFARCQPLFKAVGKTITHLGPSGAGQTCKSCNQLVLAGTLMALSEACALARKSGLDPYKMREALLGGSAQSFVLTNHVKRLLDGTLKPGFRGSLMHKDVRLALGAGRDQGVFMPVTALGAQMFAAMCNSGRGELDSAALGLLFEELSGINREA